MNRLDPPHLIRDDGAQIAQDVRLDRNRLEARMFRRDHGPPSGTTFSEPVRLFSKLYTATDVLDIAVSGGVLYRDYSSVGTGLDKNALWSSFIYNGLMYLSSKDSMRVVGTGTYTVWGIVKPATALSAASGAAGALTGDYEYKVTYVNASGIESDSSSASTSVNVSSEKIDLTSIPVSGDAQVTDRYIYRIGGTLGKYVRIKEMGDNSTTTYTDNMTNAVASSQTQLDVTSHDEPAAMPIAILHLGRAFYAGNPTNPNRLYYSDSLFPEYSGNYRVIGGYEAVVALGVWEGELFIWKQGEIFSLQGTTPGSGFIRQLEVKRGTVAPQSVAMGKFPTYVYWDGIYTHDGYTESNVGKKLKDLFDKEVNTDRLANAVATATREFYIVSVPGKGQSENSITIVYNYDTRDFHVHDFGCSSLWTDQGGAVYAGCKNPNWDTDSPSTISKYSIYELNHTLNAFDETLNFRWKSKEFFLGESLHKRGAVRNVLIVVDTKGENVEMVCYIDGVHFSCGLINTADKTVLNINLPDREGYFAELELKYSGTKRITVYPPMIINPDAEARE